MDTNSSKKQFAILLLSLLFAFLNTKLVWADLIDGNKSDSAVKMLVFPNSLRVIENLRNDETNYSFSNPKQIRKNLLKLDPVRIVPGKTGEPIIGPVTRISLRQLSKKYREDIIFVFRRTLEDKKKSIHHDGLLYLAKQKKVLALTKTMNSGSGSLQEMDTAGLKQLAKEAKKILHSYKFEKRQSAY